MRISCLVSAIWLAAAGPGSRAVDVSPNDSSNSLLASLSIKTSSGPVFGVPTDLASARAAVLATNYTTLLQRQERDRCPSGCSSLSDTASTWSLYGSLDRLERACNRTMLLRFAVFNHIDDPSTHVAISACTADFGSSHSNTTSESSQICAESGVEQTEVASSVQLGSSGPSSSTQLTDVIDALAQLQEYSAQAATICNETIMYAYNGDIAFGIYAGSGIGSQGVLASVLDKLSTQVVNDGSIPESLILQLCGNYSARYSLGVMINTAGDLGAVQRNIQSWKNGSCIEIGTLMKWQTLAYNVPSLLDIGSDISSVNATHLSNSTRVDLSARSSRLTGRAECSTVQATGGDTCETLAAECGIILADFTDYNSDTSLCGSPGQHFCCSAGTLPDFTPEQDADGYCYTYLVQTGDSCSSIGATYDLTNDEIESFNGDTWGWYGCGDVLAGYNICLSTGYPPQPAAVPNAVCGPQVNDTAAAPPGTDFSTMNECPLNACCNIWGQCGTTSEFCTISNSSTGAPGTAAPNENGCISNCGTEIVTSDAPSETYNIAYFEGFDWHRSCLRMGVNSIDTSAYTHIHFSFITLNAEYSVNNSRCL